MPKAAGAIGKAKRQRQKTERCACGAVRGICADINVKAAGQGRRLPAPGSRERLAMLKQVGVKMTAFPWTDPTGRHPQSRVRLMAGKDKRVATVHFSASELTPQKKGPHAGKMTLRRRAAGDKPASRPLNMMMADMAAAEAATGPAQPRASRRTAADLRRLRRTFSQAPKRTFSDALEEAESRAAKRAQLSIEEQVVDADRECAVLRRELRAEQVAGRAQGQRIEALQRHISELELDALATQARHEKEMADLRREHKRQLERLEAVTGAGTADFTPLRAKMLHTDLKK
jgi:hypothetical protein